MVFDANNLFGQMILLDFNGLEDRVAISPNIHTSGFGSELLTLTNPFGQSFQTLLLSGIIDLVWQPEWVAMS